MMVSKREARTNRRKALAETQERMTVVSRIRKLYSSGRPRKHDQKLSPITAYGQAGTYVEKVQLDMNMAGLNPADVIGFLVVVEEGSELTAAVPFPVSRATMDKTIPQLLAFQKPLPVCVVVQIFDREETRPEHKFKRWVSPFLSGVDADEILSQILVHMEGNSDVRTDN